MNIIKRLSVILGVSALLVTGAVTPAQARTYSCSVNGRLPFSSCHTSSVHAYGDHTVFISVEPYSGCKLQYKLRDIVSNQVALSGTTSQLNRWVFGLYSYYKLEVKRTSFGCGGDALIKGI